MAGIPLIENGWRLLLDNFSEDTLITWGTLTVHEIFYVLMFIPFALADHIPGLEKYKVQPKKKNTWPPMWKCIKYLFFSHFVVQWSMMLLFRPVVLSLGLKATGDLPTWKELLPSVVLFYVIEDFYFYWVHRALHWGPFYKYIHKKHHDHQAPFGIAAEYAHPVETMVLGLGSLLGPMLLARHLLTVYVWLAFRIYQTLEAHSGYRFPWSITEYIPFWGGAHFHDFHHETFTGNYSSTFTYMDRLFGTDTAYYSRLAEREKAAKPVSVQQPKKAKKQA
eukprot:TRINITY_DN3417_c0_g1_i1.p1 TRINITY_DN3417_c0_g1~~TRINITY_DN3417_c0_g1_i1.p1  ORF type:complete len:278 (+),score=79.56 TRINITY_DN3417_c0_g1_i1:123-956(+)